MTTIYRVMIPGYMDIGTADSITELVKLLKDADCIRRLTMELLCELLDELEEEDHVFHKFAADDRFYFEIKKEVKKE